MIFRDGGKITSDIEKVADTFHKFFANIGKTLTRIDKDKQFVVETNDVIDPVLKAIKGTLMQVWKFANISVLIWKKYVEDFTLKHYLLFELCAREICEKFVYKYSETIEYVKN